MRALVFDGPHRFHIEEVAEVPLGANDVRMRVAYVGICGSDLHGYTGESGRRTPGMVMGHEASGWVQAVGDDVDNLQVGDPITFIPTVPCHGECGHSIDNQCSRIEVIGVTPSRQGAFAEFVDIPKDRVVKLGSVGLEAGAIVEPLAVALHAARRAGIKAGDRVLVIGGGMIGQCIAQVVRYLGATATISETVSERRSFAEATGIRAVHPIDLSKAPLFDTAFDAVGIDATATASVQAVRRGGVVCFVGLGVPKVSVPLFEVVTSERSIVGTFCYTDQSFRDVVQILEDGKLDAGVFVGTKVPLEGVAKAFEDLANGGLSDIKIMMETGAGPPL